MLVSKGIFEGSLKEPQEIKKKIVEAKNSLKRFLGRIFSGYFLGSFNLQRLK